MNSDPKRQEEQSPAVSTTDFVRGAETFTKYQSKKKKHRLFLIVLAAALIIGGGGYLGIKALKAKKPNLVKPPNDQIVESSKPTIISSETKRHSSRQFFIDIDYPADWLVVDESSGGNMTITSPELDLQGANGVSFKGKIIFLIRSQNQKLPEFEKGNAEAVLTSEKITYTKPSSVQRGQTYVSFLDYASSRSTGLIDGIFITGFVLCSGFVIVISFFFYFFRILRLF